MPCTLWNEWILSNGLVMSSLGCAAAVLAMLGGIFWRPTPPQVIIGISAESFAAGYSRGTLALVAVIAFLGGLSRGLFLVGVFALGTAGAGLLLRQRWATRPLLRITGAQNRIAAYADH